MPIVIRLLKALIQIHHGDKYRLERTILHNLLPGLSRSDLGRVVAGAEGCFEARFEEERRTRTALLFFNVVHYIELFYSKYIFIFLLRKGKIPLLLITRSTPGLQTRMFVPLRNWNHSLGNCANSSPPVLHTPLQKDSVSFVFTSRKDQIKFYSEICVEWRLRKFDLNCFFYYYFGELCVCEQRAEPVLWFNRVYLRGEYFPVTFEQGKLRVLGQTFMTNTNNRKLLIKSFYSAVTRFHFIICCVLVVCFTSSKQTKQSFLHVAWKHSCHCASVQLQSASYWQPPNSGGSVAPTWTTEWVSVPWESSPIDLC